ncbi:esterase/lipase family protein [Aerolutibacter daejeonensis]|uniref:esterase/lipase family protein n=1 Tax=Aerolutibacter daejeonensis TaxID=346181 RepID=UPI000690D897|nr:alpha/beta hydrolase [Lysobacter daejeonensis]
MSLRGTASIEGTAGRRVLLLPGLWLPRASMRWHAHRLRQAGYAPHLFGYAPVTRGPDAVIPALAEALRTPTDVVAHSLGGLLALRTLQRYPDLPVGRVVCLGSPLAGSAAAEGLASRALGAACLGRSADLLRAGCRDWHGRAQVGVVAGDRPMGLGQMFGQFPGPSDGTVAVTETRLPGLSDHAVIPASHSGLLFSDEAAQLALQFLGEGRFGGPRDPSPPGAVA